MPPTIIRPATFWTLVVITIFNALSALGGGVGILIVAISWLQILYFATGLLQLVLVVALLGVVAWFPRERLGKS